MRKAVLIVAACALTLAGLATAAVADSGDRPLTASLEGSVFFVPDASCNNNEWLLRTDSAATGNVSHLGRTAMTSHHCTPAATDVEGGEMTLVAANGDEVYIEYSAFAPAPDPDTGIINVEGEFVIIGGSGRFDGASGGGELLAFVVFEGFEDPEWAASWRLTGEIGY